MRKSFGIPTSMARGMSPSRPTAPVQQLPSASVLVSPAAVQQSSVLGQQVSVAPTTLTSSGQNVLPQTPLTVSQTAAGSSVGRRRSPETTIRRDKWLRTPRETPRQITDLPASAGLQQLSATPPPILRMLSPSAPVQQLSATAVLVSPMPAQQSSLITPASVSPLLCS